MNFVIRFVGPSQRVFFHRYLRTLRPRSDGVPDHRAEHIREYLEGKGVWAKRVMIMMHPKPIRADERHEKDATRILAGPSIIQKRKQGEWPPGQGENFEQHQ